MLAELAAINAAYAVIKEVVGNGRELSEAGAQIGKFFSNKKKLEEKVKSVPQKEANLLEEFFALEEVKRKEKELRDLMLIAGRPGLLADWDRFQLNATVAANNQRTQKLKDSKKQKENNEEIMLYTCVGLIFVMLVGGIFGFLYMITR